ncbi:hypothetical protein [Methylomagnum sp.]
MASTVEWLIYAVGGGHGHTRRGFLIQRLLAWAGRTAALLVRPGSDRYLPDSTGPRFYADTLDAPALAEWSRHLPRRLIVDTFPAGWRGELDAAWLGRFEQTALIARHGWNLPGQPALYDRALTPYPAHRSEWDQAPAGAKAAGYIIDAEHLAIESGGNTFTVLDPAGRCAGQMLAVLAKTARRAGLGLDYRRRADPPFRCRKLLVVGAGYHSFYELLGMGLDLRFLPVKKRHDDQFRRAGLFGLTLTGPDPLLDWLTAPVVPVAENTRPDWPTLLNSLTE